MCHGISKLRQCFFQGRAKEENFPGDQTTEIETEKK